MPDKPDFQQSLSDVKISAHVAKQQVNTSSLTTDVLSGISFGLDVLQKHQNSELKRQKQQATAQMNKGVNKILQAKLDRDSQGVNVQQNLLQTQQEFMSLKGTLPPGLAEGAFDLYKKGLGFNPSAKITEQQVSQFDQERDALNEVGIDTRNMERGEITTTYLKLNKRDADLKAKNADIRSKIDALSLSSKSLANKEAVAKLQQRELYNSIRAIGVGSLEEQKRKLNNAKKSGNPQLIKEEQQKFLQMASESEQFFTSAMLQASQAKNITLDDRDLNSQASGVRAWSDSLIRSEDNSLLSEANKRRIDLVTSDIGLELLTQSPEISTYATLASLKIPVDPVTAQSVGISASAIVGKARKEKAFNDLMKGVPGDSVESRQEIDLTIAQNYTKGGDLVDSLQSMRLAGRLGSTELGELVNAKMADERGIAKQIMDSAIETGGGSEGKPMQLEAEGVLFSAVNSTMKRAVDTGDLSRLGPNQVGYVLDVITHPNYEAKIPQEVKEEIKNNLGKFTSQVFEKQYFNDASLVIAKDLGSEGFEVPPLELTVDDRGNMKWSKNKEFVNKSKKPGISQAFDIAFDPNFTPGSVHVTSTPQQAKDDFSQRIDQLITKLNRNPVGNQLIDANAKVGDVDKKELATRFVARGQASLLSLDRKMFKVSDSVLGTFETEEIKTEDKPKEVQPQLDERVISEVVNILKDNPDANLQDIVDFMSNKQAGQNN